MTKFYITINRSAVELNTLTADHIRFKLFLLLLMDTARVISLLVSSFICWYLKIIWNITNSLISSFAPYPKRTT
jgi:hypothetical protein